MTNYRPVALLTTFSEVFEKVICNRLSHHIEINNILVPEQFGYQKVIYTENAAFILTKSVLKSITGKMHVGGISVI
jgi:hypothetical protein